ncbi:hypothetical protein G7Y89_g2340 [Cudoniella acicularis]|uniref:Uncharacterized protein n=1 Tax=Cudoniella acicularis TaxID=354080 RepID=A0A8H4RTM0_9HELO|nr:hypothetical protein G7Y89_g2340 [Cudoniella acicularis]
MRKLWNRPDNETDNGRGELDDSFDESRIYVPTRDIYVEQEIYERYFEVDVEYGATLQRKGRGEVVTYSMKFFATRCLGDFKIS